MSDEYDPIELTRRHALFGGAGLVAATALSAGPARAEDPPEVEYGPLSPAIEPRGPKIAPYTAACVQTLATPVFGPDGSFLPESLSKNVNRVADWATRCVDETGAKLISFSEFCLQPSLGGATVPEWIKASLTLDHPHTEKLREAAQKSGAYLGINTTEVIDAFPDRYFLSGWLFDPSGEVVLNYRKLGDATVKTRPGDILSAWLDEFGSDSLFPVADTEIGRIAFAIALDVRQPELLRGAALKGAEIFLNPTASPAPPGDPVPIVSTMVRRVRAYENMAYLLLSNLGPVENAGSLTPTRQPSQIIDFRGNLMAIADDGREGLITADLDVDLLRQARTGYGSQNLLGALQVPVHRLTYETAEFAPVDEFTQSPIAEASAHADILKRTIEDLVARNVLVPPGVT